MATEVYPGGSRGTREGETWGALGVPQARRNLARQGQIFQAIGNELLNTRARVTGQICGCRNIGRFQESW